MNMDHALVTKIESGQSRRGMKTLSRRPYSGVMNGTQIQEPTWVDQVAEVWMKVIFYTQHAPP